MHRVPGTLGTVEESRDFADRAAHRGIADAPIEPRADFEREPDDPSLVTRLRSSNGTAEADAGAKQAHAVDRAVDVAGSAVRDLHLVGAEALLRIGIDLRAERAARQRATRAGEKEDDPDDRDRMEMRTPTAGLSRSRRRTGARSSPGASR
jgi:hypothetical protein